jgi:hypothetical protein
MPLFRTPVSSHLPKAVYIKAVYIKATYRKQLAKLKYYSLTIQSNAGYRLGAAPQV